MAKKAATTTKKPAASKSATTSSPVRNTPIPKVAAAAKKIITDADIAVRAFEIYVSGTGGDEKANWVRAERELRGI